MFRRFGTAAALLFVLTFSSSELRAQTTSSDLTQQFSSRIGALDVFSGASLQSATETTRGVDLTFSGGQTVHAFAQSGNSDAYNYALALSDTTFNITSSTAGADYLSALSLSQAVFIYAESDNQIAAADLPSAVTSRLQQVAAGAGNTLSLRRGVNAFVQIDFGNSVPGRFLTQELGLTNVSEAFSGILPDAIFVSHLTGASQEAALSAENFALSGSIGKLALKDVPTDFIKWPGTSSLSLAADETGLALKSESSIEMVVAGNTLQYDLTIEGRSAAGAMTGKLDGKLEGQTLISFGGVSVSGLEVTADNTGDGWDLTFNGTAEVGSKSVEAEIEYTHAGLSDATFDVKVSSGLTLADLLPSGVNLPGLSSITIENAAFGSDHISATLASANHSYAFVMKSDGNGGTIAIIEADALNLGEAIPGAASSFLANLSIVQPVLVLETGTTARELSFAGLPDDIRTALTRFSENSVQLQPGLNVFATFDPTQSQAASVLQQVGLNRPLPLTGAIDPQILTDLVSHAKGAAARVSNTLTAGTLPKIDLTVPLPQFSIPGTPQGGVFKSPELRITRGDVENSSTDGTIKVAVTSEFDITVAGSRLAFPGELDFATSSGNVPDLSFTGSMANGWSAAFGVSWLQIDSLDLAIASKAAAQGTGRDFSFAMSGTTDLGQSQGVGIDVDLTVENNQVAGAEFKMSNALSLSDLPPLGHLPAVSKIGLANLDIKIAGTGNNRELELSGEVSTADIFSFQGLTFAGGTFRAQESGQGWNLSVVGNGDLNSKAVQIDAKIDTTSGAKDYAADITGDIKLSDLAGSVASALDSLTVNELLITGDLLDAKVTVGSESLELALFKAGDAGNRYFALTAGEIDLGNAIPGIGSALNGALLKDGTLVLARSGTDLTGVSADDLPEGLATAVTDVAGGTIDIKAGVTVLAQLDVSGANSAKQTFDTLAVPATIPIKGSIDPTMLVSAFGSASTRAAASARDALANLDLEAPIGTLSVPGLPSGSGFTDTVFHISGSAPDRASGDAPASGIYVSLATDFTFSDGSTTLKAPGEFDFSSAGGATELKFAGEISGGWSKPFGLSWLHIDELKLDADIQGTSGNREVTIDFAGVTDLGKAKGLTIAIDVDATSAGLNTANVDFTGALTLADLPALASLPRADGFELDGFKVAATRDGQAWDTKISSAFTTAKLVDFPGFTVNGGTLDAEKGADGWTMDVTAKATLHDKEVDVAAAVVKDAGDGKADYEVTVTDDLTISELVGAGNSIPGLNALEIKEVRLTRSEVEAKMTYKTDEVDVLFYHPEPNSKTFVALTLSDFNLGDHIPGTSGSVLSDVTFGDLALIVVPEGGAANSVSAASLPEIVSSQVSDVAGATVSLKQGLNMYGMLEASSGTQLADIFSSLGISDAVPLKGSVDPQMLANAATQAGQAAQNAASAAQNWTKTLDISATLPTLAIPGIPDDLSFETPTLEISTTDGTKVAVSTTLSATVGSSTLSLPGEFDFTSHGTEKDIEFKGGTSSAWAAPLDVPYIHLANLGVDFTLKSRTGGSGTDREIDFALSGETDLGKSKGLPVVVAFEIENKKLVDGEIQVAAEVDLADIPVLKGIPHADKFGIKNLAISTAGIGATAILDGEDLETALVNAKSPSGHDGWTMIVERNADNLGDLIPFDKSGILKKMPLTHALFVLSENGMNVASGSVPEFAQPLLQPIFEIHPQQFSLDSGLILAAVFDPNGSSDSKSAFGKLGLGSSTFLMGELGGIFGGTPLVKVEAFLPTFGKPSGLPKFMSWPESVSPAFFVELTEEAAEVGIEVDMNVKAGDDDLTLATKLEMEINEADVTFDIEGEMDGTWDKPFNIKGLKLANVALKAGVSPDGSVKLGFKGTTEMGSDTVSMAADIEPDPELLGIPKSIAFQGTITSMGPVEIVQLVEAIAGEKSKTGEGDIPFFELHNVTLAFATPGAEDPDLGIISAGFAAKGALAFMDHDLGDAQFSISETAGLVLKGDIDPMHLGPIQVKNNSIDVAISTKSEPHFKLQGDVAFLGLDEKVIIDVEVPSLIKFEMDSDFGALGTGKLILEGVGFDLKTGKASNADFIIDGELENSDFSAWLDGTVKDHVDAVLDEVKKGLESGLKTLKDAENKVNGLNKKIEDARAKVRAERNRELNKLHQAEDKVNSLKKKADDAKSHRKHCHWYQVSCKAKYEGEYLAFEASRDVAEGVLHAIEKAIDVIPVDLDPRVSGLLLEKDTALAALKVAELAVEGAEKVDELAEKVFNAAVDGIAKTKPLVINDLSFKGSLQGSIKHDEPWLLNMDYAVFKQPIKADFVFKLKDPVYDAKELGYVALQLIQYIIKDGIKDFPQPMADRFNEVIGKLMQDLSDKNKAEMDKHRKDFEAIAKRQEDFQKELDDQQKIKDQQLAQTFSSGLDIEPASDDLSNILLEVGHSGQCLTHKGNNVVMEPCSDSDRNQRWTTKKRDNGYVEFQNQNRCVKPATNNPDLGVQLQLDVCDPKNNAEAWKVLSHDKDFYRIGNRDSQKCLHFTDPSATPGQAKGEWWPCHGADSQAFRALGNTQPKYYAVNAPLASEHTAMCLGTFNIAAVMPFPFFPQNMPHPVFATQCSILEQAKNVAWLKGSFFNYSEDLRGYLKIFDYQGNCLFPESTKANANLVSRPCDHADDMFWEKIIIEDQMQLKNKASGFCIDIIQNPSNKSQWLVKQLQCNNYSNQALSFGMPKPRATWTSVSGGSIDSSWHKWPGSATDIAVGANGDTWMVSISRHNYALYKWNGNGWTKSNAENAMAVAVAPDGTVWYVDRENNIYTGNGTTWRKIEHQSARDIAVGGDGSVWFVGMNRVLYRLDSNDKNHGVSGGTVGAIAADPHGNILSTNTSNQIWARIGSNWTRLPGAATNVSIGADGSAWIVGTDGRFYRWNGKSWDHVGGANAVAIAVMPSGNVVTTNKSSQIWEGHLKNKALEEAKPLNVAAKSGDALYLCRVTESKNNQTVSWTGTANSAGVCSYSNGSSPSTATSYEVLSSVVKGNWVRFGGGNAPFDAVHTARNGYDVRFSCRVKTDQGEFLGWAQDGSCNYGLAGKSVTAANFEYLVSE